MSAYIHNNAKDLPGYAGKEEFYRYSSYGIYTGHRKDTEGIIDTDFLLKHFGKDKVSAQQKYRAFTESMRETGIMKEVNDKIIGAYTENVYISEKRPIVRHRAPEELILKISKILGEIHPEELRSKHNREASKFRAFTTYVMRNLCGYTYKKACEYIGNMSVSGISRLSNEGFKLFKTHEKYRNAFSLLVQAA